MELLLNGAEIRVLGSLMEKETTTPEYYPLSLNALVNACNQKSNREPVLNLDESAVREALNSLNRKGLAGPTSTAESRVTKYEHRIGEVFNLGRRESALLCVLLLRGPQTPGELRGRCERMHRFDDLGEVLSTLQRMAGCSPPLVKMLPRQPGTKESRYAHLLSGDVESWAPEPAAEQPHQGDAGGDTANPERMAMLEAQVASLQQAVTELKQQIAELLRQSGDGSNSSAEPGGLPEAGV